MSTQKVHIVNEQTDKRLQPTIDEIKAAVESSGYLLEQRVCPVVESHRFLTTPNEQYTDQDTGKSREIDIHAINMDSLGDDDFSNIFETILLIECKNNSTPAVFFSHENPLPSVGRVVVNGYPDGISVPEDQLSDGIYRVTATSENVAAIEQYFAFEEFHHNYQAKWIARQFCQMKPKVIAKGSPNESVEWSLSHEGLYESIDSLAKATEYFSKRLREGVDCFDEETQEGCIHLGIVYPILLFSGQIYECRISKDQYELCEQSHLVFYRTIRSRTIESTFHIDVIREEHLPRLLNVVKSERSKISQILEENLNLLISNVKRDYREKLHSSKPEEHNSS
jgi:hypothetical protein